jgi:hypothetical protein
MQEDTARGTFIPSHPPLLKRTSDYALARVYANYVAAESTQEHPGVRSIDNQHQSGSFGPTLAAFAVIPLSSISLQRQPMYSLCTPNSSRSGLVIIRMHCYPRTICLVAHQLCNARSALAIVGPQLKLATFHLHFAV